MLPIARRPKALALGVLSVAWLCATVVAGAAAEDSFPDDVEFEAAVSGEFEVFDDIDFSTAQPKAVAVGSAGGAINAPVEHYMGGQWVQRGVVKAPSHKSNKVKLKQEPLGEAELRQLQQLCVAGEFYRIRVPASLRSPSAGDYAVTVVDACALVRTCLADVLIIHVGEEGAVFGLELRTRDRFKSKMPVSRSAQGMTTLCAFADEAEDVMAAMGAGVQVLTLKAPASFSTSIAFAPPAPGPLPYVEAYVEAARKKAAAGGKEPVENQSFFAKYWMYIVPVLLMLLLSGGAEQPQQGGGGGGGGGGAAR